MTTPLSDQAKFRVGVLFSPDERASASALLEAECGDNLPFCADSTPTGLDRIRFAALKLSGGNSAKLRTAVDLAKRDWRDLLVAAGFAHDIHAHEEWLPENWRKPLTGASTD